MGQDREPAPAEQAGASNLNLEMKAEKAGTSVNTTRERDWTMQDEVCCGETCLVFLEFILSLFINIRLHVMFFLSFLEPSRPFQLSQIVNHC